MQASLIGRRAALAALAAGAGLCGGRAAPRVAAAQEQRPVVNQVAKLLVGFPPGGPTDVIARLLAERLRGTYAPQVVVENRAGAGGRLAIEAAAAARPDGATAVLTPESIVTIFPHVYPRTVRYDALVNLTPVTPVSVLPYGLAVRADHPARDLPGLVAWARGQREPASYASAAAGSMPHFVGVQAKRALGVDFLHVPYRGSAPAIQALLGGEIQMVFVVLGDLVEFHRGGQLRTLAITAPERSPRLPEVPTFAELGHSDLTAEERFGVFLPGRAPAALVEGLRRTIVEAVETPALSEAFTRLEFRPYTAESQAFAQMIRAERDRWGPIVRESGFQPED